MSTDLIHVPRALPPAPPPANLLADDVASYLLYKKKRLTAKSELSYKAYLGRLVGHFPNHTLPMFEPPFGSMLLEDFLNQHWGERAPATYNKAHSVLCNFFAWHVIRMNLMRDPMLVIERATERAIRRTRFTEDEWLRIFAANPDPHDQIALHLLLDYGLRKGALQNVQFEHFDRESHELTIFTKGEKIFRIDIPDGRIWRLLAQIDEPGHHYLLCRRVTRRRSPPDRKKLTAAAWLVEEAAQMLASVTDKQCVHELEMAAPALQHLERWVRLAADATRIQTRYYPDESIGEHGAHIWWYHCLARAGVVKKGVTAGRKMHSARYTAAQRLLEETSDIKAVQTLLCHANSATTDLYVQGDSKKVGDRMADYVGRGESDLDLDLQRRTRPRKTQ